MTDRGEARPAEPPTDLGSALAGAPAAAPSVEGGTVAAESVLRDEQPVTALQEVEPAVAGDDLAEGSVALHTNECERLTVGAPAEEQPDARSTGELLKVIADSARDKPFEDDPEREAAWKEIKRRTAEAARLREQLDAANTKLDVLEAALQRARRDIIAVNIAGWDSERGKLASAAVERINRARAALGDVAAGANQVSAPSKNEGRAGGSEA